MKEKLIEKLERDIMNGEKGELKEVNFTAEGWKKLKEEINKAFDTLKLETLEAIIKEVEGKKKDVWVKRYDGKPYKSPQIPHYNRALSDLLTTLQAELEIIKKEI